MSLFDKASEGILNANLAIEDASNAVRNSGPVQAYKGAGKVLASYPYTAGNVVKSMLSGDGYKPGLEKGAKLYNEGKDQFFGGALDIAKGGEKLVIGDRDYNTKYKKYEGVDQEGTMSTGVLMNTNKPVSFADMNKEYSEVLKGVKTADNEDRFNKIQSYKDGGASQKEVETSLKSVVKDPGELAQWNEVIGKMYQKGNQEVDPYTKVKSEQQKEMEHTVKNKSEGKGDATGNVTVDLPGHTPLEEGESSMGRAAEKVVTKMETPDNWYESPAFSAGLLRFGLGLLSGEGLGTAFGGATESFTGMRNHDKRESFRDEMIASGYEPYSIEQWVQTGESGGLKKATTTNMWKEQTRNGVLGQIDPKGKWVAYGKDALSRMDGNSTGGEPGTDAERKALSRGTAALTAAGRIEDAYQGAQSELEKSNYTSDEMYNTLMRKFAGVNEKGFMGIWVDEQFRGEYPALAEYVTQMSSAITPLLRDDSGATITDPEMLREMLMKAPKPNATPEEASRAWTGLTQAVLSRTAYDKGETGKNAKKMLAQLKPGGKFVNAKITPEGVVLQDKDGNWYSGPIV
jgi:enamine deaminase RidA (YjgF/YER057c/UK114 family)